MTISKNIHQIWIGDRKSPPYRIMESWKRYCAKFGWKYYLWTENEIEQLLMVNRHIYDYYKSGCDGNQEKHVYGMSNIARLEIVNKFGGYYFDCDFYSWGNNIEDIVRLDTDMAVFTPEHLYPSNYTLEKCGIWLPPFAGYVDSAHFLCNGAFYANPNNNILTHFINNLDETFQQHLVKEQSEKILAILSPETCGCWQLSNASKKYPFILLSPRFIFLNIQYVLENSSKTYKFQNELIASCISNYDESSLNLIE